MNWEFRLSTYSDKAGPSVLMSRMKGKKAHSLFGACPVANGQLYLWFFFQAFAIWDSAHRTDRGQKPMCTRFFRKFFGCFPHLAF